MLDTTTQPVTLPAQSDGPLSLRRTAFAVLCILTCAAILALAIVAVPPTSFGAISFLVLFGVTLPWGVIGFWNALIGFIILRCSRDPSATVNPLARSVTGDEKIEASTAILMCIRNESPQQVIRNLTPLLNDLANAHVADRFHVYLLSDTNDPRIIEEERTRFDAFAAKWQGIIPVTYRRREINTAFKSGNIADFCARWGANHEFALTLDADSFMPAHGVLRLVRIAQANPRLGILQTLIVGLPSASLFARVFQYGMRFGMRSYTLGAAWWQGDCGPYWGHNALIRLAPFIAHCQMPVLPGKGPLSGVILSHDQIEAALMRRAGYEVRVLVEEGISWEENPPTLLEFSRRDLRWCQGNMQYWSLLGAPGLAPVSRFHIALAILMYLGSFAWMAMTAIGMAILLMSETRQFVPIERGLGTILFAIMMIMTFAPKVASIVDVILDRAAREAYGGGVALAMNAAVETVFMMLLAPILALAHTIFMIRVVAFRDAGSWPSQNRESHAVAWEEAFEKFWPQTLAGCAIMAVVALKAPHDLGFALMGSAGMIVSVAMTVFTASPVVGLWAARTGVCRMPEERNVPADLEPLKLPAIEAVLRDVPAAATPQM
jgi:membrane glycosyltransferase